MYKSELLKHNKLSRTLRSSCRALLTEKCARLKNSGDGAFSVCVTKLWNMLPESIRTSSTLDIFPQNLFVQTIILLTVQLSHLNDNDLLCANVCSEL